jgi:hypothetical protein
MEDTDGGQDDCVAIRFFWGNFNYAYHLSVGAGHARDNGVLAMPKVAGKARCCREKELPGSFTPEMAGARFLVLLTD